METKGLVAMVVWLYVCVYITGADEQLHPGSEEREDLGCLKFLALILAR